jgi:hypothetical protein
VETARHNLNVYTAILLAIFNKCLHTIRTCFNDLFPNQILEALQQSISYLCRVNNEADFARMPWLLISTKHYLHKSSRIFAVTACRPPLKHTLPSMQRTPGFLCYVAEGPHRDLKTHCHLVPTFRRGRLLSRYPHFLFTRCVAARGTKLQGEDSTDLPHRGFLCWFRLKIWSLGRVNRWPHVYPSWYNTSMVRLPRLHAFMSLTTNTKAIHNTPVISPVSRHVQEPVNLSCINLLLASSVHPALTVRWPTNP